MSPKLDHWTLACSYMTSDVLKTDEFRKWWTKWVDYRREKRNTLTSHTIDLQIRKCEEWGHDKAIAAIKHTVFKGWRGLQKAPNEPVQQTQQPGSPIDDGARARAWWAALSEGDQSRWDRWMTEIVRGDHPGDCAERIKYWKDHGEWAQRIYDNKGRAG